MFTVKQAAEKLGVSAALVYALVAARKIRHERHGLGRGAIRIPEDALDEYRRRRTVPVDEPEAPEPYVTPRPGQFSHLPPS